MLGLPLPERTLCLPLAFLGGVALVTGAQFASARKNSRSLSFLMGCRVDQVHSHNVERDVGFYSADDPRDPSNSELGTKPGRQKRGRKSNLMK